MLADGKGRECCSVVEEAATVAGVGAVRTEAAGTQAQQLGGGGSRGAEAGALRELLASWCCVPLSSEEGPSAWDPGGWQPAGSTACEGGGTGLTLQVPDLEAGNWLAY